MNIFELIDTYLKSLDDMSDTSKQQSTASMLMQRFPSTPAAIAAMAVIFVQNCQAKALTPSISQLPEQVFSYLA